MESIPPPQSRSLSSIPLSLASEQPSASISGLRTMNDPQASAYAMAGVSPLYPSEPPTAVDHPKLSNGLYDTQTDQAESHQGEALLSTHEKQTVAPPRRVRIAPPLDKSAEACADEGSASQELLVEAGVEQEIGAEEQAAVADDASRQRSMTYQCSVTRRLGRYELAFQLASGGFATVYLARVVGPGGFEKFVALKRIHSHLANKPEFVEMFLDEARIAACINHPNVCPVFDFGHVDESYYLAMDYVMGESLSRVMQVLRMAPPTAENRSHYYAIVARVIAEIADGLHAAHDALGPDGQPLNVVHRDVAPANIFIRYDGHVQILDFGIASAAGKLHMTATGVMKGHLSYVAPEQFRAAKVDRRTDVWGVGVILWEMLTGQRLYRRDSDGKTMLAIMSEPLPKPSKFAEGVPMALELIVAKALEKEPDQRFQTARDMSEALHSYLRSCDESISPHQISTWLTGLFPHAQEDKRLVLEEARAQLSHARLMPIQSDHEIKVEVDRKQHRQIISKRVSKWIFWVSAATMLGGISTWLMHAYL